MTIGKHEWGFGGYDDGLPFLECIKCFKRWYAERAEPQMKCFKYTDEELEMEIG